MSATMNFKLRIWRQPSTSTPGRLEDYAIDGIRPDQSILELLDTLNEKLIREGRDPVEFDSDCREGICGTCGLVIDGVPHGMKHCCTTCELRMRNFQSGQTITIEPFRANAFPVLKDLVVDRSAFDRIMAAGGYISTNTGSAPDANNIIVPRPKAECAMDAATCIGCGACVAACPNASASLFTSAKISQFAHLPQGEAEALRRVERMVKQMDAEGFGDCSNHAECEAACPKAISITHIAVMRRQYIKAIAAG